MLRNSSTCYGLVSVFLHWSMTLLIIGLFALGLWMVTLDYYDVWYHDAPQLHKSLGLLVAALWLSSSGELMDRSEGVGSNGPCCDLVATAECNL